jgi:hypothetical protein
MPFTIVVSKIFYAVLAVWYLMDAYASVNRLLPEKDTKSYNG